MTQLRRAGPALIAIVLGLSAPAAAQDAPAPGSPAATAPINPLRIPNPTASSAA